MSIINNKPRNNYKWILITTSAILFCLLLITLWIIYKPEWEARLLLRLHPYETARLIGDKTLEVYPRDALLDSARPICTVLVANGNQFEYSEIVWDASFHLNQDRCALGPYNYVPLLWWCDSSSSIQMPQNSLEQVSLPLCRSKFRERVKNRITSTNQSIRELLEQKDVLLITVYQQEKHVNVLVIPESKIQQ